MALLGLVITLASSAMAARAQDDTYRRLAEDATRAMSEHRLDDALSIFREMHAIQPSARTLWSLGRVHHELGRYVLAISFLDQALADARRPLDAEQRRQASELRARAEALTGVLELRVEPADAIVLVDDVELRTESIGVLGRSTHLAIEDGVQRSELTVELRLDAGEHVIRVERAGQAPSVRRVPIEPGAHEHVDLATAAASEPGAGLVAPVELSIDRGGLGARGIAEDVRVLVALAPDTSGPLHVSLQPLAQMSTITAIGERTPLCDAPCDVRHARGTFGVSVTRDDEEIVDGVGVLGLGADTQVLLRYRDETSTRIAGWTSTGILAAYGLVATVLGSVALGVDRDDAFREVIAQDGAVVLLSTGIPSVLVGLLSLLFALQPDWVEIGQLPL